MVNKRQPAAQAGPGLVGKTSPPATTITSSPTTLSSRASSREIIQHIWQRYLAETPQRTFLLDAFMIFLVIVGGVQFLYCVLAGNFVRYLINSFRGLDCLLMTGWGNV